MKKIRKYGASILKAKTIALKRYLIGRMAGAQLYVGNVKEKVTRHPNALKNIKYGTINEIKNKDFTSYKTLDSEKITLNPQLERFAVFDTGAS